MFQGLSEDYYGPPQAGQSFAQYESYMSMKNVAIGSGIVTLAIINPIIGIGAGIGWLLSGPTKTKRKPTIQGG